MDAFPRLNALATESSSTGDSSGASDLHWHAPMADISRRAFVGSALALGTVLALPTRAAASVPATAQAANFYQALGVNGHNWYVNTLWYQRLVDLGVPNLRAKAGTNKDFINRLGTFFNNGGKLNATIVHSGGSTLDRDEATKNLAFLKNYVGLQRVSGIEGPNEFNSGHPANWANTLRDFVHWLHDTVRADSAFNPVPLIAPSIWKRLRADYLALGDVSAWVDKGCIHYYSTTHRPTMTTDNTMQGALNDATIIAPGKTIWMTESGWQSPNGNCPVTPRAQAKYVLRDYFDAFGYGVEKLFMYQIIDDQSNLFGLCDANANPKPAFTALQNLVDLVKDQRPSRGSLNYSIPNAPVALKSFSFTKSDGSFLLVFYLDVDNFDPKTGKDVETSVPITVNLPASARSFEIYQPTFSATASTTGSGSEVSWFASDQVTVVQIRF